ncbi:hypothetical protein BDY21DRAFT_387027 [Lineolata rhizophorae]|uniref:DNA-directed RNA polymerase subunit n=1 Tax=Lineolata rhizophorae TaxID=578093 RepID=A0A6A6NTY7_9PEZI|nr:hypothetical protein BDY21DRAFT_387027 [Lineolata rhizophorae]
MNPSRPPPSAVSRVEFGHLSDHEVRALSVKRICNPSTFDSLLHPVPGGLYDTAMGSFQSNLCATCELNAYACPGHCGHIELPVPVYHVTYMDQCLRLLRGTCMYCFRLKMHPTTVHKFACKLRLIRHGLLNEVDSLEDVHARRGRSDGSGRADPSRRPPGEEPASGDGEDEDGTEAIARQERFVRRAVAGAERAAPSERRSVAKTEAAAEKRRLVVREFLARIAATRKCARCGGITPTIRKDRYSKIFIKPLGKRDRDAMVQKSLKLTNAVLVLERRAEEGKAEAGRASVDEGVADMYSEGSSEDVETADPGDVLAGDDALVAEAAADAPASGGRGKPRDRFVSTAEAAAALTLLFGSEQDIFGEVYGQRSAAGKRRAITPAMFFLQSLLVPPNKYRPEAKTGRDEIAEAAVNSLYKSILTRCQVMSEIREEIAGRRAGEARSRPRDFTDLQNAWVQLQEAVNTLIDSSRGPMRGAMAQNVDEGIKQKLEKKEGLFRQNMMGKRVNFAARSVISPDPNIETNEIGVPPVFASKLTYPEPVTSHNFYELKEAVLNGPEKWPGAAAIENESGQVVSLRRKNYEERQALANQLLAPSSAKANGARNKKVHRHLVNGDLVVMNRQPTLHKPSVMAHRARVLPGEKTIRMHYANCNTYNADFDGDEMNMHFPQNELARAEAATIADTDHQYLSATAGNPLRGLIQDHVSMGVALTSRDTLFTREEYHQLLYAALRPESGHTATGRLELVPPAIVKPRARWTGKQVVTTVLENIVPPSHSGLTVAPRSQGSRGDGPGSVEEDKDVFFSDGYLVSGILDKKQIGPSSGGLINAVHEAYGHTVAGKLISVLGRLLTRLLHTRAFSCGVEDLVLTAEGERRRKEELGKADALGLEVASRYVSLKGKATSSSDPELRRRLERTLRDEEKQSDLDVMMNSNAASVISKGVTSACLPGGLVKQPPGNQMQAMTTSGAKGSTVNANLISCNLGQQVLEGRRVPTMVSGKTLPCFKPFEPDVRAGGYITQRFLTGIRPQGYFFHAMAGREGLIDTAVKTSRSGYLQRCLIKGMEGLRVEYDNSVRDSDGTVVQFLFGEDGLDVTAAKHLADFRFLGQNFLSVYENLQVHDEYKKVKSDDAAEWTRKAASKYDRSGRLDAMDPGLAVYSPSRHCGSTSEKFLEKQISYIKQNPDGILEDKDRKGQGEVKKKVFERVLLMKYLKSLVEPGEAVGVVAGQSVGEPSTQMTLNTFHLAGHSARNVTLGIPRLREIVMTASSTISTPAMTLHPISEMSRADCEKFAKGIGRLSLAEVVDKVSVAEKLSRGVAYEQAKSYEIRLDFYPPSEYCEEYAIGVADVLASVETKFLPRLQKTIRAEVKKKGEEKTLKAEAKSDAIPDVGTSAGAIEQEGDPSEYDDGEEDDEGAEGDATSAKRRASRMVDQSYDGPEEGEREEFRDEDEVEDSEDEARGESRQEKARDRSETPESDADEDDVAPDARGSRGLSSGSLAEAENRVKENPSTSDVSHFKFDRSGSRCGAVFEYDAATSKILMLNLVESALRFSTIHSIPGIKRAVVAAEKGKDEGSGEEIETHVVQTEGVNLVAMREYQDMIDPRRVRTNDTAAVLRFYGVEAARANIIREMAGVFESHHISVDVRHLQLIADVMTKGGGYRAFNRMGLANSASPFTKMSFETTVGFLRDAVLGEDWDDLTNPSSRIVVGRLPTVGTGAADVMVPVTPGATTWRKVVTPSG